MNIFLGEYQLKFTGQGRIILPKKIRQGFGRSKKVYLSRGLDGCIFGYPENIWKKLVLEQLELPVTDQKGRNLRRYFFSAAESTDLDEQGRFVIPVTLLDFAKLKVEVVLIGAGDHFEIWNQKIWAKLKTSLRSQF